MRLIGVVDLLAGRAVHARAGRRETYQPVGAISGSPIEPGNAAALARVYIERFGLDGLYVADLDAIEGRRPQWTSVDTLASLGAPLWLDAGVSSLEQAHAALGRGATRVIVGLETLRSEAALADICRHAGKERVVFSLDLRDGAPMTTIPSMSGLDALSIATLAAEAGAGTLIVIDLARVGTGAGPDVGLVGRLCDAVPRVAVLAGGGIRDRDDIARLAGAGCDGVLLATALQNGRIGPDDVTAARRFGHDSVTR
jgi:phosphoribosylformimino-5-aminoimidazole carboxamide ribotide isomerase